MAWPPIPDDWATGEVLTSNELNALFEALRYLDGAWDTYTPAWSASSSPSIGNGTITGGYLEMGNQLHVRGYILGGSTTSGGSGQWTFGLPSGVTISNLNQTIQAALRDESSNNNYPAFAIPASTTTLKIGAAAQDWLGNGDVFTFGEDDRIWWGGTLEID